MALQQIDTIEPSYQQLIWLNKNNMKRVAANIKRASNGAAIVQQTAISDGLPVIVGTADGWMTRADFNALVAHSEITVAPFTIKINGDTLTVIWDHTGDAAVTGEDLWPVAGGCDTLTNVTLRFFTVTP